MFQITWPRLRPVFGALLVAGALNAQTATLNTTLFSSLQIPAANQVYDVTGFSALGLTLAVVCRGTSGADIVEVSANPPVVISHINPAPATANVLDAAVHNDVLYLAQSGGVIQRYDVSSPAGPVPLSSFGGASENLFIDDGKLYVARGSSGGGGAFEIWDLAPATPSQLFTYDNGTNFLCRDLTVKGDRAYVFNQITSSVYSTVIFEVSTPGTSYILGTVPGGGQSGAVYTPPGGGATVLVCCTPGNSGIVQTWDVSYSAAPAFLGSYQSSTNTAARNVRMIGSRYALVAYYLDGLRILDLANPAQLTLAGMFDPYPTNIGLPATSGYYGAFAASDSRIYVTNTVTQVGVMQGLTVVDFLPPAPLTLSLDGGGTGGLTMNVTGGAPSTLLINLISAISNQPFGTGPVLGLGFDALFVFYAYTFPPFQDQTDAAGNYALYVAPGSLPTGYTLTIRSLVYGATTFQTSELGKITF
jgi:hypothetical protein